MPLSPSRPARRNAPALLPLALATAIAGCSNPAPGVRAPVLGEPKEDERGVLRDFRDSPHHANLLYRNRELVVAGRFRELVAIEGGARALVECGTGGELAIATFGERWRAELESLAPGEVVCLRGAILSGGKLEDGTLALALGCCELLRYPRRRPEQARAPLPRPVPVED
jgi:hypothetical protein